MRDHILFYINGKRHEVRGEQAFIPLSDYLRYELGAVGTKVVCAEGDCGACTVLQGRLQGKELTYKPVNSCIQYLYQLDCSHLVTIEGLKQNGQLNPVQNAMVNCHGAQCGYCTPGFVVTMCGLFETKPNGYQPTATDIRDTLTGNLCRCTGYDPIIEAGRCVKTDQIVKLHQLYPPHTMQHAFGQAMRESIRIEAESFEGEPRLFFNPVTVEEAVRLKSEFPNATIIQGGTDISVVCNKRHFEPPVVISFSNLPTELETIRIENEVLVIGTKVSLMQLQTFIADKIPELHAILETFGGPQIKAAGTLAGNIANGSPIGDTIPFLMVMDAEVEATGLKGSRRINLNQFYQGYKKLALQPDEIITRIFCPLPKEDETLKLYKVSRRKHLDIATFTAAILMRRRNQQINSTRIAYGGVGPTVVRLPKTEASLAGKAFGLSTFEEAGKIAQTEISPITDVRGSQAYRLQLAENILLKFFYDTAEKQEALHL